MKKHSQRDIYRGNGYLHTSVFTQKGVALGFMGVHAFDLDTGVLCKAPNPGSKEQICLVKIGAKELQFLTF